MWPNLYTKPDRAATWVSIIPYNEKFTKISLFLKFFPKTTCKFIYHIAGASMYEYQDGTFLLESIVHGYHICKEIWSSVLGEELQCIRSIYDFYTVKVVKTKTVWKWWGIGRMIWQYSIKLPQSGLEISCKLRIQIKW